MVLKFYNEADPPRVLEGPWAKQKFRASLRKIIYIDIGLDNNAFITFFTGGPEDNYSDKVVYPTLAQRVRAQRSTNKETGSVKQK